MFLYTQIYKDMQKIVVIDTAGFIPSSGVADQITLPNGKYAYTRVHSQQSRRAKIREWEVKTVDFFGACNWNTINDRAHCRYPIQIDDANIRSFLEKVATEDEIYQAFLVFEN